MDTASIHPDECVRCIRDGSICARCNADLLRQLQFRQQSWQRLAGSNYHPPTEAESEASPAAEKAQRKRARKEGHAGPLCIDCRCVSVRSRGERCTLCREDARDRRYGDAEQKRWLLGSNDVRESYLGQIGRPEYLEYLIELNEDIAEKVGASD